MVPLFKVNIGSSASKAVQEVLESGMIGEGPKTKEFTDKLVKFFDNSYVVSLNSCTSALTLALRIAHDKKPGGVVITPSFTFPATNTAILTVTDQLAFIAPERETFASSVQDVLTGTNRFEEGVKAVVLTLVGGVVPKDFDILSSVLQKRNIPLIIDAAHALTTTYKGKHISYWADFTCFSFQAIKHLTTGDGGAIVCRSYNDYELINRLKWFGMDRNVPEGKTRLEHQMEYSIPDWGYKFHMNDIAAAIGLANFDLALKAVKISQDNALYYQRELQGINYIKLLKVPKDCQPSWWTYGFNIRTGLRNRAIKLLAKNDIQSSPLWKLNHEHECFKSASKLSKNMNFTRWSPLFIPNGFWVTQQDREKIVKVVGEIND